MTEPLPGPDELIERAARTMRNRFSMQTPPTEEDFTNARALARDGLLAGPGLQAELERLRAQVEELTDFAGEQANARRESDRVRRLAAREAADLRDELATSRRETEDAREDAEMRAEDRTRADVERDLALWLHAEAMWRNEGLDTITAQAVRLMAKAYAERDAQTKLAAGLAEERNTAWRRAYGLHSRIDAALELVTDHHSMEVQRVGIEAIRAALQGDPPSSPLPVSGEQATEAVDGDIEEVSEVSFACRWDDAKTFDLVERPTPPVSGAPEEQQ